MVVDGPRPIQVTLERDKWVAIEPSLRAAASEARGVGNAYFDMDAAVAGNILESEASRLSALAASQGSSIILRWSDAQYAALVFALETAALLDRECGQSAEADQVSGLAAWLRSFNVRFNSA